MSPKPLTDIVTFQSAEDLIPQLRKIREFTAGVIAGKGDWDPQSDEDEFVYFPFETSEDPQALNCLEIIVMGPGIWTVQYSFQTSQSNFEVTVPEPVYLELDGQFLVQHLQNVCNDLLKALETPVELHPYATGPIRPWLEGLAAFASDNPGGFALEDLAVNLPSPWAPAMVQHSTRLDNPGCVEAKLLAFSEIAPSVCAVDLQVSDDDNVTLIVDYITTVNRCDHLDLETHEERLEVLRDAAAADPNFKLEL